MGRSGNPGLVAAESLRAAADRLVGDTIESVGYVGELSPDRPDAAIQQVHQGVLLQTGGGWTALVRWFTPGYGTGIEVVTEPEATTAIGYTELAEVSSQPRWAPLLGRPITRLGAAWADQGLIELPRAPWSLRLEIGVDPVVIAMGEKESGRLLYSPTSVLVFFDGDEARRYVPAGDPSSAWGEPLASALAIALLVDALDRRVGGALLVAAAAEHLPERDSAGQRAALVAALEILQSDGLVRIGEVTGGRFDAWSGAVSDRLVARLGDDTIEMRTTPAGTAVAVRFRDELYPRPVT